MPHMICLWAVCCSCCWWTAGLHKQAPAASAPVATGRSRGCDAGVQAANATRPHIHASTPWLHAPCAAGISISSPICNQLWQRHALPHHPPLPHKSLPLMHTSPSHARTPSLPSSARTLPSSFPLTQPPAYPISSSTPSLPLPRHHNERDAALAYDRAASLLLGNSAKLNFEGRCPTTDDDPAVITQTAIAICQVRGGTRGRGGGQTGGSCKHAVANRGMPAKGRLLPCVRASVCAQIHVRVSHKAHTLGYSCPTAFIPSSHTTVPPPAPPAPHPTTLAVPGRRCAPLGAPKWPAPPPPPPRPAAPPTSAAARRGPLRKPLPAQPTAM